MVGASVSRNAAPELSGDEMVGGTGLEPATTGL